ncbi:MFS transporter [Pseudoclavibacter sp. VKM Ac-2867]|uniref:MFS transporter n=1 Tax=Pseudoclavibacter sp. VKM Ac-2867 TaxID=2783829 RepID=UPI001E52C478|nr:MFS transporter [Pseudoclavibacter sp. VKM Ac-2867]
MSPERPSYASVLRTPHLSRSFLASIIGRLSLATSGLALILLLEQSTGSFAVAGIATATLGVANVVATPWRARLIDRHGQRLVVTALGLVHAASLLGVGLSSSAGLPTLLLLSALAGVSAPPFGAVMRVLWAAALPAGPQRTRGFSLDAVAEEVTFAVGPLAAAVLAVVADPLSSLVVSAGCVALGTALFVTSPRSRAQRGSRQVEVPDARPALRPLRSKGFLPIVLAMTAPGVMLGCVEVAAPAVAAAASSTVLAGALLAVFAAASAIGGLLYGRWDLRARPERQLLVLTLALLAILTATGLLGGVGVAILGFALSGIFLAPTLIVGYLAADARTDSRARTEASSWINTAVNLGAALGAAAFGALTDIVGPGPALTISAIGTLILICGPLALNDRRSGRWAHG